MQDRICNKYTKEKNGRKNIFYSDASSAVLRNKFFELGGYNFEVPTNEDVYLANKIVESGYSFIYASQSRVWHSHQLSLKETYKRYRDIGKFEKLYENEIDFSKTQIEGGKMVKYILKNLLLACKFKSLMEFLVDTAIKLFAYKIGEKNVF